MVNLESLVALSECYLIGNQLIFIHANGCVEHGRMRGQML
jgi:hypothetical protein